MVPADSHRVPRAPRYSGSHYGGRNFGYGAVTRCGATFQTLLLASTVRRRGPTTPGERISTVPGLGWSPFARHYWGNHCCFLFLEVLRCFSSLRSPPRPVPRMTALQAAGLSHSETRGSKVICTSPRIIAAYRVLHRLREPRHPPCALACFPRNRGLRATQGVRSRGAHTFSCVEMFNVLRSRQFHLTTVLLVQHVKDRCGNDGDRCRRRDRPRPSRSAKWRITDSNR